MGGVPSRGARASAAEQVYRYLAPSEVHASAIVLATSSGQSAEEHPRYFDGFLRQPETTAHGLLTVARMARTRYYTPPGMVAKIIAAADPVVTSEPDRLHFEAFSPCGGVYARLDVLSDGLDRAPEAVGATNVDFNPPMREALARVTADQPVRLQVGQDAVGIKTFGGNVIERKVTLAERWVRGFAEVHITAARLSLLADLAIADARQFLRSLPSRSKHVLWAVPAGASFRLSSRSAPGAACVAGAERLRILEPLLRFASRLRVYGAASDGAPTSSAWALTLDGARFTVVLSPEMSRGFSGEGGVLLELAGENAEADAECVRAQIGGGNSLEQCGLSAERVRTALTFLAAQGQVGYDLARGKFFHRPLPLQADALLRMNPRLLSATQLVNEGCVELDRTGANVRSGDIEYRVTFASPDRCTCPWWGKYSGSRGPCKHVLAARRLAGQ
jgi:hypothetical protein